MRKMFFGAARELQLLQIDLLHNKGIQSFSYNSCHLVNQKATIRVCVSALDAEYLSVFHTTSKRGSEDSQQSRCVGTLFLLFLFHCIGLRKLFLSAVKKFTQILMK